MRRRHLGHRHLMSGTVLWLLERRDHGQDGDAALKGMRAPCGEGAPVSQELDVKDNGQARVSGPQEVGVHRVGGTLLVNRVARRQEGLREHLAPKHSAAWHGQGVALEARVAEPPQREGSKAGRDGPVRPRV